MDGVRLGGCVTAYFEVADFAFDVAGVDLAALGVQEGSCGFASSVGHTGCLLKLLYYKQTQDVRSSQSIKGRVVELS